MKSLITLATLVLISAPSFAAQTTSGSFSPAITANSRNEALIATSDFNALPREDMTYLEIGGYGQRADFGSSVQNNNVFYFEHSRGITDSFALDFNLDYTAKDSSATTGSTGISRSALGGRSNFASLGMNWIYGANLVYVPETRLRGSGRELAIAGQFGFEENVDIATWGLQIDVSSENTNYSTSQSNFTGFFEMPFVANFNMGLSGGIDLASIDAETQRNHAKIYGKYSVDRVSAVQVFAKQQNEKINSNDSTSNEMGLALSRVF